jgi:hypothetical protein
LRRLDPLRTAADFSPGSDKILHILAQLFQSATIGGSTNDEAAGSTSLCAQCVKCPLQSLPFIVRANFS